MNEYNNYMERSISCYILIIYLKKMFYSYLIIFSFYLKSLARPFAASESGVCSELCYWTSVALIHVRKICETYFLFKEMLPISFSFSPNTIFSMITLN